MKRFLCLVTLLLYRAYSQCTTSHASSGQSLLMSISVNAYQVDKIGKTEYLSTIESAVESMTPATGRMGVNIFGGITGQSSSESMVRLSMGTTSFSNVQSTIQALTSYDFSSHYGNKVSAAVLTATGSTSFTGQKYHVLFAAGMPLVNGQGTGTKPINYDNPCPNSMTAKENNIQQYVALIGIEGTDFVKEFYSCMVEDPDTDIIVIDPSSTSTGIAALKARVCKTNGYDVKITEVNPIAGTYAPYIEVLNRGASASIIACWGSSSCSTSSATVPTGSYYVGYSSTGTAPTNTYKGDSLAANGYGSTGWTVSAWVAGSLGDTVTHGSDAYWQNLIDGRTFELRAAGYENSYGANWRVSCPAYTSGSPGSGPSDCQEESYACDVTDCLLNGNAIGLCSNAGAYDESLCTCGGSGDYIDDTNTCMLMPVPTACTVNVIRHEDNKDYVYFAWDRVRYDGEVDNTIGYQDGSNSATTWDVGAMAAAARVDVLSSTKTGSYVSVDITSKYTSPIQSTINSRTVSLSCRITTLNPTQSPSTQPTPAPSGVPTVSPTPKPTHDAPGVMLTGFCSPDRCECFERERTCCQGFGADVSAFTPPAGCNHIFHNIELEKKDEKNGRSEFVTFGKYGDEDLASTVSYQIKYHGVLNRTDFEELEKWTDGYFASSRRLQDANTPSPTTVYGNPLNILMTPPGTDGLTSSTVSIGADASSAELELVFEMTTLKCVQGGECPTTYDECKTQGLGYQIQVTTCDVTGLSCAAMYPYNAWLMVYRSNSLCRIAFGIGNDDETLPSWLWWVLLALLIFLLCLCWLVYRYWWSQKKKATELGDAVDELDQQHADNEAGFGKDLDVGDVAFNPMATGVPGMNRPADAFGNELHQRQMEQQNDMVDVQAEIFQVRQDYGQVATGPRKDRGY